MKNEKKIITMIVVGIVAMCIITLSLTYAYWQINKNQTGENVVNTDCFNIEFVGENDILLNKAYPMTNEELKNFLATETPYTFTITNECSSLASATINMETVPVAPNKLKDEWIDVLLYDAVKNKPNNNLNNSKKLTGNLDNTENKILEDSEKAYALHSFTLKANETKTFNLLIYLNQDTPAEEENMNATWKGKITLSTEYKADQFENAGTLRQISEYDSEKMWEYKDKITKIVIQNKIQDIPNKTYGPFDESVNSNNSIQSYVACEDGETNCIGYLQGNGGIKLNEDSSYLFSNFTNLTKIEGIENLDTSNVTNMSHMFYGIQSLQELDLSNFDTSKVTNMNQMFDGVSINGPINLKSFETSQVTDMEYMFDGTTINGELDLTNFDFSSISSEDTTILSCPQVPKINLSGLDFGNLQLGFSFYCGESGASTMYHYDTIDLSNTILSQNTSFEHIDVQNLNLYGTDFSKISFLSDMFNFIKTDVLDLSYNNFFQSIMNSDGASNFFKDSEIKELNLSNWDFYENEQKFGVSMPLVEYGYFAQVDKVILNNVVMPSDPWSSGQSFLGPLVSAKTIELKNVDTSHVTNMSGMFGGFANLTELDLSSFDTSNVTDMSFMFDGASSLEKINYGNKFVYNDGMSIDGMFDNCKETLNKPDHPSWKGVFE